MKPALPPPSPEELVGRLQAAKGEDPWNLVESLVKLGNITIEPMIRALQEGKIDVYAAAVLSRLGKNGLKPVLHLLKTGNAAEQKAMLRALEFWEGNASQALPLLRALLKHEEAEFRHRAILALASCGDDVLQLGPQLIGLCDDPDPEVRRAAAATLLSSSLNKRDVLKLATTLLSHAQPEVRSALKLLRFSRTLSKDALPLALRALQDSDEDVRWSAIEVIEKLGNLAMPGQEAILRAFACDPSPRVRQRAAKIVWNLTHRGELILPLIVERLSEGGGAAEWACDMIGKLGPQAHRAEPALISALQNGDEDVQWAAAEALEAIGAHSPEAVGALIYSLGHPSGTVAASAAKTLASLKEAALPALIQALQDESPQRRQFAMDSLGQMGTAAKQAIPQLLRSLLQNAREDVRSWATIALGEIEGKDEIVGRLVQLLRSKDATLRWRAARSLGRIGVGATSAIPELEQASRDSFPRVSEEAVRALKAIRGS